MHSLKLHCLAAMAACAVACAVQHRPTLTSAQREDIFIDELRRSGEPMWSPLLLSVRRADIIQSAQGACASGLNRDEMIQRSTGGDTTTIRVPLAILAVLFDRLGRYEPAATIVGFALSPFSAAGVPEITTAITHLREVLGDQTYESLALKGETMTTAGMTTYAYDQIDQARTTPEHPSSNAATGTGTASLTWWPSGSGR
jgi:hypothetical protein